MTRGLLLAAVVLAPFPRDHAGKVPWVTDPTAGMAAAQAQGKMALIYFSASW